MKLGRLTGIGMISLGIFGCDSLYELVGLSDNTGTETATATEPTPTSAEAKTSTDTATETATGTETEVEVAVELPPASVCKSLVKAIKSKKLKAVLAKSVDGAKKYLKKKTLRKMAKKMKKAKCGEPEADGDRVKFPVKAGKDTRDIHFVKVEDEWKFDVVSYAEAYSKGGKKKKKKRKKKK